MRRKVSVPVRSPKISTPSPRMVPSPTVLSVKKRHPVTKVPLAVSVSAFLALIAVLVGTLAAVSMQRDDASLRADLAQSQEEILARIQRLEQKSCTSLSASIIPPTSNALPVVVSATELNNLKPIIDIASWNSESANTNVEYRDKTRKISFQLPYSKAWGNATYKVAPFEVLDENHVRFGAIVPSLTPEGTISFQRGFTLEILPLRTLSSAWQQFSREVTDAKKTNKQVGLFELQTMTGTIPWRTIKIEFSGKKFNYVLSSVVHGEEISNEKVFLSIIRSLKSI